MAYLGCFTAVATISQDIIKEGVQKQLLIASIVLGFIHLSFEVRQIIYDPIKWIQDFCNLFDVIAYLLPIYTSILWLQTNVMNIIPLTSFSCLFLDIKFLLFFRAIEYFGVYFAIIISVGKQIISFLVVFFIIIISFAHAFYILLIPRFPFSYDERTINDDLNNPWNIASSYNLVLENGTMDSNPYIIQPPSENTNMFVDFRTSIFAMYKFLTGVQAHSPIDNNRVSYLLQKAEILAEIELFYLLPNQRRWESWFPEIIYYYANVDKTREKVNDMIKDKKWNTKGFPKLKENLIEKFNIQSSDEI
ncbi:hypothetical protein RclHR1_11040008 [Rhizophagus clarus]|uniref:Ion transport domain-containing protein n=1 Tax=Rhizophagus clarus TaxID=94130 RepID=A0A2Z6Q7W4_9GLOM|nr:hypothetical protein RclHR1_11040008 [Rhizophagus clarus]